MVCEGLVSVVQSACETRHASEATNLLERMRTKNHCNAHCKKLVTLEPHARETFARVNVGSECAVYT